MQFMGVLISCDMFDKNAVFRRSDSSAFSLRAERTTSDCFRFSTSSCRFFLVIKESSISLAISPNSFFEEFRRPRGSVFPVFKDSISNFSGTTNHLRERNPMIITRIKARKMVRTVKNRVSFSHLERKVVGNEKINWATGLPLISERS